MKVNTGFTLIELMIVVAIVSITLTIGLPSFQSLIASNRLTTSANAMTSALQLARAEALKQHKHVVVIPKGTGWISGWNVFVDTNSSNSIDGSESTFTAFDALSSTLTVTSSEYPDYVLYSENGRVNAPGSFMFSSGTDCRKVEIAITGRVKVTTPTSCS